ncbi:MAG: hypothetical protein VYC34_05020, partial [Planctomycetota bacterium]|nr:hypothetical protein [Planctomycetota bacterium]
DRLANTDPFYIVGDWIFCHRGMSADMVDEIDNASAWVAFQDPRVVPGSMPGVPGVLTVLTLNGDKQYQYGDWDTIRNTGNWRRRANGLPLIPPIDQLPPRR